MPEELVKKENKKENQIKTIQYIDLDKYHKKNIPSEESKKELFERNKNVFFTEFKSIRFAEITPEKISGSNQFDKNFFKQLDIIENYVLDGQSFDETVQNDNLESIIVKKINANKEDENKNKVKNISDNLFKKIYSMNSIKSPEIINLDNKYYIAEISNIEKKIEYLMILKFKMR